MVLRIEMYFELASHFNTSILNFIVFLLLLFILPSGIPPVIIIVTPYIWINEICEKKKIVQVTGHQTKPTNQRPDPVQ